MHVPARKLHVDNLQRAVRGPDRPLQAMLVTTGCGCGTDGRTAQAAHDGAAQRRAHRRADHGTRTCADRAAGQRPIRWIIATAREQ